MRRGLRLVGTLSLVAGACLLVWAGTVWIWQDPFTALYTSWQQHRLAERYDKLDAQYRAPQATGLDVVSARRALRREAAAYRASATIGAPIGRIRVPRMGLNMILVNGTDHESLKKGPGRDPRTFMPGQGQLVYIAGHRTTYLAPFSDIDALRARDTITVSVPYATFTYAVVRHRVVTADDLSVLRSPGHEVLELQACHPRFFATHRYIVYARLVAVRMRGSSGVSPTALAAAVRV